jgi:hypothetical protein
VIPSSVEILGSSCFRSCESLSSISFESNSRLLRIESYGFGESSLQSIVIPNIVEIIGSSCFRECKSLSSISFESNSRLMRIKSDAFSGSSLQSIVIPNTVEILGSSCFRLCESLSSISFESNSRLKRIESRTCCGCHLSIVIPSTVVFVAYDAHPNPSQLLLSDPDSCPIFDRWQRLRRSGITVDFQRILRFASYLPCFKDFVLYPSRFEERSVIGRNKGVSTQIHRRRIDRALRVVKAISLSGLIERRLEVLARVPHHRCEAPKKSQPRVLDQCQTRRVAVAVAVTVASAEAIASAAPQHRKALPTELSEERGKVRDDHASEAGWRRLNCGEGRSGGAEGRLFSPKISAQSSSTATQKDG